jgi:hypothetical protein
MPQRIQRKRTKGWRMPANAVYVGRPTKWGNPFEVWRDGDLFQCVTKFRDAVTPLHSAIIRRELRGKDLACWCALDQPCHAAVLLKIANDGIEIETA